MASVSEESDLYPVSLDTVLATEVAATRERFPDAYVELGTPNGIEVQADQLLGDVIQNVLRNAIEHNDSDPPHVEVSVTTTPETATIVIADDGPGVPDTDTAEIFLPGEPGPRQVGKGFGLYLVSTVIERYGGDVEVTARDGWWRIDRWAEMTDPSGSVFRIELPRTVA